MSTISDGSNALGEGDIWSGMTSSNPTCSLWIGLRM